MKLQDNLGDEKKWKKWKILINIWKNENFYETMKKMEIFYEKWKKENFYEKMKNNEIFL